MDLQKRAMFIQSFTDNREDLEACHALVPGGDIHLSK
jgi:hypothetical protein